jgi:beta-galactosidase
MVCGHAVHPASKYAAIARATRITFPRQFAPEEPLDAEPERPFRSKISLNGTWRFEPEPLPAGYIPDGGNAPELPAPSESGWSTTPIKIPSPWNVNAFNLGDGGDFRCFPSYPASWEKASMGWMKRSFKVPASWNGRRIIVKFDAVAGDTEVIVNGRDVAHNFDLFLPFEADVTGVVKPGETNEILVGVRKASLVDDNRTVGRRPYPGGSMWGQSIAGIWQDVSLEAVPEVHVTDCYVQPHVAKGTLDVDVTVRNDTGNTKTVDIGGDVRPWINLAGRSVLDAPEPKSKLGPVVLRLPSTTVSIPADHSITVTLSVPVNDRLKLWAPESPNLYGLTATISSSGPSNAVQGIDARYTRFGWREYAIRGNRLFLNGKPIELRGDSWHFMGIPQMTRSYAWSWFTALKAAHGNAVRLHAQPYPSFYLDMADEMGVCVLDETAIWGSDAGHKYDSPDFWNRCDDHVTRLVLRDRNHPSVFGWSVSNELGWYADQNKRSDIRHRLDEAWRDWLATCGRLDPSRPWVSTDGDGDADGIMPTSIMHYGDPDHIARTDKPYGEGETGGAYYATPKYAAKFAGPSAYRSQEGRMKGIAIEAYDLIKRQRRAGASYASVFNLAWYGLQPLELGLPDTTRPYTINDGIFFGPYRENVPGVQPERLGPYCTTFNPGYDPRLPLYRKWPLADAIAAAYAPGGPTASPWAHAASTKQAKADPPHTAGGKVLVLAGPTSPLASRLTALGATVIDDVGTETPGLIIVDGADPAAGDPAFKSRLLKWVNGGATCLVLGPSDQSLTKLNALLPKPIALTDRHASSLIVDHRDPLIAGMDDGDFYFTETVSGDISRNGLTGPFVEHGVVVLEACPADWRRWNNRPESMKTAAILRSEREAKPAGASMVAYGVGRGQFVVSTLDLESAGADVYSLLKRMMENAGVAFAEQPVDSDAAFDTFGHLRQAAVCGRFPAASTNTAYDIDNIGVETVPGKIGESSNGREWKRAEAGVDGAFDFLKLDLPGPTENAAVYLSFWVWSPRPLDNLLIEPNMPKLDLLMGSDDGCQVWLNGKLVKEDRGIHPVTADSIVAENLPLQRGWNHFLVKVVQATGGWGYQARLRCSDPKFLLALKTSIMPQQQ